MLLIYTPESNVRIKYAAEVCFKHILKLEYKIITNIIEFEQSTEPCFWYAKEKVSKKPGIIANDMMLLDNTLVSSPGRSVFKDINVLFPTSAFNLPEFDLFASVFWYVTRMEEYDHYVENAASRFFSNMSIAHKLNVIDKPIVNIWVKLFLDELAIYYPALQYDKPVYRYIPSIDVDSAFKYKHKGFVRNTVGLFRDIFRKNFKEVSKRLKVLTRNEEDPWFCFDKINELHGKYSLKPYYFFLLAKYGYLDKNISPRKKSIKKLISGLYKQECTIGIHMSYKGNKKMHLWRNEIKKLQKVVNSDIFSSRQHYIFIRFPETYQHLIKLGIKRDFSMIYHDMPGFRLGTTVPIPFFDLSANKKTELWLYPTMIMDVSLKQYQNLSIADAEEQCRNIINYTKKFGGTLITLWHNESLSGYDCWKEWLPFYEKILEMSAGE